MDKLQFPYIINDEPQLSRFVTAISIETARRTAREVLIQTGQIKPMITVAECYRLASSRAKVDTAMAANKLKYIIKGRNKMVKLSEFETWLEADSWECSHRKQKNTV